MEVAGTLGSEMLAVCLDFDDRVMRMGYGDVEAVKLRFALAMATPSLFVSGIGDWQA